MSDRGDYKEPDAGDWMVVCNTLNGDVNCLRVEQLSDNGLIATLSDGSTWAVETGAPLHRKWSGHVLWPTKHANLLSDAAALMYNASAEALAEIYGILLRDKQKGMAK